jgi:multidrug efflux pump subunit AcrA (membrane-fusion protein)
VVKKDTGALAASGYVVARRKATVAAEITGKVMEVLIEEGMTVTEGQVVARLDSVLAESDLALARSRVEAADAAIGAVTADLKDAPDPSGPRRWRRRVCDGPATKARTRWRVDHCARPSQRDSALDAERSASVLGKYRIRAPFSGVVVDRSAQPGEMISPMSVGGFTRTGICTIVDMDSIEIEVDVNEAFIGRVVAGSSQRRARCLSDWSIPVSVTIVPTANREGDRQGSYPVRAEGPRIRRQGGEGDVHTRRERRRVAAEWTAPPTEFDRRGKRRQKIRW